MRIMFDPAGRWEYLSKFFLCNRNNRSRFIKKYCPGTGSSLVKCQNIFLHHYLNYSYCLYYTMMENKVLINNYWQDLQIHVTGSFATLYFYLIRRPLFQPP